MKPQRDAADCLRARLRKIRALPSRDRGGVNNIARRAAEFDEGRDAQAGRQRMVVLRDLHGDRSSHAHFRATFTRNREMTFNRAVTKN